MYVPIEHTILVSVKKAIIGLVDSQVASLNFLITM